jgi:hypothetical protein
LQDEYSFSTGEYQCIAARSDRTWGNGLKVSVFDDQGQLLNVVHFSCHPEQSGYDTLQAMRTDQLIKLAARQLKTENCKTSLAKARQNGLILYYAFQVTVE